MGNIHMPNCLEFKRLTRQQAIEDLKRFTPEARAEQIRTGIIPGQRHYEIINPK